LKKSIILIVVIVIAVSVLILNVYLNEEENLEIPSRESKVPANAVKITPETDKHPPIIVSDEYEQPVPLPYPVNTKGAEDSTFIMPNGNIIYVWFTPDTEGDVHVQARDLVTGI